MPAANKYFFGMFILLLFFSVLRLSSLLDLRSEAASGKKLDVSISFWTVADLYFGSPIYQSNMENTEYGDFSVVNSALNPIPVIFRSYSNKTITSVDEYNFSLYGNALVKDQVPMFYYDIYRNYGAIVTVIVWLFYLLLLFKLLKKNNIISTYFLVKCMFFSIFSIEGVVITLIYDIAIFALLSQVLFKKDLSYSKI